ncbi:hypothetical protein BC829DRAFT_221248 [Chytridium lagenaria]|nr:hypothetical protein BC829DRAFT_221248 [Chytridium lagenaria]
MFESPASVLAVPALFGTVIKTSFKAPLLVLDAIDACDPFTVLLPEVDGLEDPIVTATVTVVPEPTVATAASPLVRTSGNTTSHIQNDAALNSTSNSTSAVTVDISSNATTPLSNHTNTTPSKTEDKTSHLKPRGGIIPDPHDHPHNPLDAFDDTDPLLIQPDIRRSSRWFVLIPRGNCPFDVKIYHAQKAGFSGAIIYNNGTSPYSGTADIPVRMSSNTLGDRISFTSAMYLTQHDGKHLLRTAASHRPPGYYTHLS